MQPHDPPSGCSSELSEPLLSQGGWSPRNPTSAPPSGALPSQLGSAVRPDWLSHEPLGAAPPTPEPSSWPQQAGAHTSTLALDSINSNFLPPLSLSLVADLQPPDLTPTWASHLPDLTGSYRQPLPQVRWPAHPPAARAAQASDFLGLPSLPSLNELPHPTPLHSLDSWCAPPAPQLLGAQQALDPSSPELTFCPPLVDAQQAEPLGPILRSSPASVLLSHRLPRDEPTMPRSTFELDWASALHEELEAAAVSQLSRDRRIRSHSFPSLELGTHDIPDLPGFLPLPGTEHVDETLLPRSAQAPLEPGGRTRLVPMPLQFRNSMPSPETQPMASMRTVRQLSGLSDALAVRRAQTEAQQSEGRQAALQRIRSSAISARFPTRGRIHTAPATPTRAPARLAASPRGYHMTRASQAHRRQQEAASSEHDTDLELSQGAWMPPQAEASQQSQPEEPGSPPPLLTFTGHDAFP